MTPAIQVDQVVKHYGGFTALAGVSLQIEQGEFFGLLGPNGAGKTTLISILAGLNFASSGKTAVIIGFGDLGQGAGRAAKVLGMEVIAVTRSGKAHKLADRVVRTARLDSVLPKADFVVITAPLTAGTRGLITRARLDLLKPGAGFINIGRSPIADYEALREKLNPPRVDRDVLARRQERAGSTSAPRAIPPKTWLAPVFRPPRRSWRSACAVRRRDRGS